MQTYEPRDDLVIVPGGPNPFVPYRTDTSGVLRQQLRLLCDFEKRSAGSDPLYNRYPENSGVSQLAATGTPDVIGSNEALVGTGSAFLNDANPDYFSTSSIQFPSATNFYTAMWGQVTSADGEALLSRRGAGGEGFQTYISSSDFELFVGIGGSDQTVKFGSPAADTTYFIEAWVKPGNGIFMRVNDGARLSTAISGDYTQTAADFEVGTASAFGIPTNGYVDQLVYEVADFSGNLVLPSYSTWQYNGGAGRTTEEYASKFGLRIT